MSTGLLQPADDEQELNSRSPSERRPQSDSVLPMSQVDLVSTIIHNMG